MKNYPDRCCDLMADLKDADDIFEFLEKNFNIEHTLDGLNELSDRDLKCSCYLFGTALLRLSEDTSAYHRLLKMLKKRVIKI